VEDLYDVLHQVLISKCQPGRGENSHVYLLIDALDELSNEDEQKKGVLEFLRDLARSKLTGLSLLVSSRNHDSLVGYLTEFDRVGMDYHAIDGDIARFVPQAIENEPRLKQQSAEIKKGIVDRLVLEAKGM